MPVPAGTEIVNIYLDDDVPEYMDGIIRCGSVTSVNYLGETLESHDELIDNTEYHSEEEMIADVAERLGVNPEIVVIGE